MHPVLFFIGGAAAVGAGIGSLFRSWLAIGVGGVLGMVLAVGLTLWVLTLSDFG